MLPPIRNNRTHEHTGYNARVSECNMLLGNKPSINLQVCAIHTIRPYHSLSAHSKQYSQTPVIHILNVVLHTSILYTFEQTSINLRAHKCENIFSKYTNVDDTQSEAHPAPQHRHTNVHTNTGIMCRVAHVVWRYTFWMIVILEQTHFTAAMFRADSLCSAS